MNASLFGPANAASPPGPMAPPRLADGGGSDYERRLLQSARLDGVPQAAAAKMAAALGGVLVPETNAIHAGGPSTTAAPGLSGSASGAKGVLRLGRHWAAGLLGMSVLGAIVAGRWLSAPARLESASSLPALEAPASVPAGASAAPALENALSEAAARESAVPERAMPPATALPHRSSGPKGDARSDVARAAAPAAPSQAGLLAEVRALEEIQAALEAGQPRKAAQALAQYRRRFPQGELALEADVIEVDVALARGERHKATERASALLARPAASRYRARLRSLLEADLVNRKPAPLGVGSNDTPAHMRGQR